VTAEKEKAKVSVIKIRKHGRAKPFDDNRKLMHFAKLSSREAIGDLLESGISVVYLENGKLLKRNPDQTVTVVKELENREKFDLREYLCHG